MSAARYTNKLRTQAETRVRKVQYRYNEALNYNPLAATCAASPDFSVLQYTGYRNCRPPCPPPFISLYFLDGGTAYTNVYDGGYPPPTYPNILQDIFNPPISMDVILDSGYLITLQNPDYVGGSAFSVATVILDGGKTGSL